MKLEINSQLHYRKNCFAIAAGLDEESFPIVTIKDEYTPAVFNNPDLVDRLKESFVKSLGSENVL